MHRQGRSSKCIVFMLADRLARDRHYKTFMESVTGMSILYRTYLVNERSLHEVISRDPLKKIIIILIDEIGLQNRQFRQCLITCTAAKLNMILFVDDRVKKERVLQFFSFIPAKRYENLEKILKESISFDGIEHVLKKAVTKIREFDKSRAYPVKHQDTSQNKVNNKSRYTLHDKLGQCLIQHKVVLIEYPLRSYKTHTFYSYNLNTGNRNNPDKHPASKLSRKKYSSSAPSPQKVSTRKHLSKFNPSNCQAKCLSYQGKKTNTTILDYPFEEELRSTDDISLPSNPTIEISSGEFIEISEKTEDMPWLERDAKKKEADQIGILDEIPLQGARKSSFDYIAKTYLVCDPSKKRSGNDILYVNFPLGVSMLRRDNEFIFDSSRRGSFVLQRYASSEDFNLEFVHDHFHGNESPLPSPCETPKFIYQDPLPAFSQDICFPPVGLFPCDSLQRRRPSVFDVLLV